MSQFIGTSMPRGFAGDVTRGFYDSTTEVMPNDTTTAVTAFGVFVKLNSGKSAVTPIAAHNDTIEGIAIRDYTQVDNSSAANLPFVTVLKRGYVLVTPATGLTIKKGEQVYLDVTTAKITNVATNNTAVTGARFMGPAVDGLVEIAYNI